MAGTGSRTLKLSILADIDNLKKNLDQGTTEVSNFGDKIGKFGKAAGLAFAAATAAAATYAAKLLVDGVKSAIEDEAAQAKLETTLKNVTGATDKQIAAVEDQILKTELLYGVTDDKLRPSLDRLVRSTKDVDEAQKLQNLALDIAAGTGKDLQTVSEALAKAHDGNFTALKKLGGGIDENIIKSKDFDAATASLAKTFEGQATKQAETFAGKMDRLKIAFDEGKETVGGFVLTAITPLVENIVNKVIPAIQDFASGLGGEDGLKGVFTNIGDLLKNTFRPIIDGIQYAFNKVKDSLIENKDEFKALFDFLKDYIGPFLGNVFKIAIKGVGIALDAIIDTVAKLISGFRSLAGFISDVVNNIKSLINLIKNNPVVSAIGGLIDNAFGGGRATGGSVTAGTSYLVGEKGAELFTPSSSGFITPNSAMGGNTVINLNVTGAIDPEGTARSIINVLNNSYYRGTNGAAALVF
jgi:phage-related protein